MEDTSTTTTTRIIRGRTAQKRTQKASSSTRPTLHEVWKDSFEKKRKVQKSNETAEPSNKNRAGRAKKIAQTDASSGIEKER